MIKFGLVKTSLIDYPGEVAAVLFTYGCNLRCPYCHNPELVTGPEPEGMLGWGAILEFLEKRKKVLGGVCISGGEPLLHKEIPELILRIKALGLKVKIDTNGTRPDLLAAIRPDYVAMDIKTTPEKYDLLAAKGTEDEETPPTKGRTAAAVRASVRYIIDSGWDHEFRTTVVPGIVDENDIREIAGLASGAKRYVLSQVRPELTLDQEFGRSLRPFGAEVLERMKLMFDKKGIPCRIRFHKNSGEGT